MAMAGVLTAPPLAMQRGIATAQTTVTVTILDATLVMTAAHTVKTRIKSQTGRPLRVGAIAPLSQSVSPISALVMAEPSARVAPAMITLPHSTPFCMASLKFMSGAPPTDSRHRATAPTNGGKAVPWVSRKLATAGRIGSINSGRTHIATTKKKMIRVAFSRRSAGVTLRLSASKSNLETQDRSGRSTKRNSRSMAAKQSRPTGTAKAI